MIKNLLAKSFIYFIFFLTLSCNNDKDGDGIRNDKDKCPGTRKGAKVDIKGCEVIDSVGTIRIFIDASASMQGYFANNADGKNKIDKLITDLNIDTLFKTPEIWILGDSVYQMNLNSEAFARLMVTRRFAKTKSSQLHKHLQYILDKHQDADISILVSDCILSYADDEIGKNREINKDNLSILSNRVKEVFSLKKNKMPILTSIYGFPVNFNGIYYDYQNTHHNINSASIKRPLYFWTIGNETNISKLESRMEKSFPKVMHVNFGLHGETITDYKLERQIERLEGGADWDISNDNGIENLDRAALPARIPILVDLNEFPSYLQDVNELRTKCILTPSQGVLAQIEDIILVKDLDLSEIRAGKTQEKVKTFTHVFLVSITRMDTETGNFAIELPLRYDWYEKWNTTNDISLDSLNGRTFGLSALLGGLRETYEQKNTNYLNLNIKIH